MAARDLVLIRIVELFYIHISTILVHKHGIALSLYVHVSLLIFFWGEGYGLVNYIARVVRENRSCHSTHTTVECGYPLVAL